MQAFEVVAKYKFANLGDFKGDKNGNFLITIKKADKSVLNHSVVGVEPTTPPLKTVPFTENKASHYESNNITSQGLKNNKDFLDETNEALSNPSESIT